MSDLELTPPRMSKFWSMIHESGSCWLWQGKLMKGGYGGFYAKGETFVHRVSYRLFVGPIPAGMTIDHLCGNPSCVNPNHLEPASMRDNALAGYSVTAKNARKTHCPQGHPYDEQNTYHCKGWRFCRPCNNEAGRRYRAKKRGLAVTE